MSQHVHLPRYCGIYYIPNTIGHVCVPYQPIWLPQVTLSVDSTIRDTSSSTILTQTFVNPSEKDAIKQAKYNFPLYESCAVVAFRCFVGKLLIQGVVKEKEEAKVEYKQAVERGETAGLLVMHTPDVFSTSLGNIPAGETIKVEIEYIMDLKHDAEVDGLRFTIPTSIAPRYGDAPFRLDDTLWGKPIASVITDAGMKIAVKFAMPSNVQSVQSPSHTISIHLGGHVENVPDGAFNPKLALATLSQRFTSLGADFIILVKCAELSSPRALLETHPTITNSKALMVTLVPKFNMPAGVRPEIVFVADRSGSMDSRIEPLKSALTVFLKSLPVGVKFNICSFGSNHTFLWEKSQPYSADTLEQAQKHVQSMSADYGGTEIYAPIQATIARRYKDIPLEIMVLTDGEVWDTQALFKLIETETASGDVRVFSLGVGRDVSHAMVEGMSRVGGGFSQVVSDEKEGFEGKAVRMLRGALSSHVNGYSLTWEGRPTEEEAKGEIAAAVPAVKKKINLFDVTAKTDPPISTAKSPADRFAHLPAFPIPTVIQSPYKISSLLPFSRTTIYAIISGDVPAPKSVWIRGTTISGDELELEIPVQVIEEKNKTIHQLAARKILQELEEGKSYLHSGKYGVDKEKNEGTFSEWVDREGIRVGITYGVASKWTSFVAVGRKPTKTAEGKEAGKDEEKAKLEKGTMRESSDDASVTVIHEGEVEDYEEVELDEEQWVDAAPSPVQDSGRAGGVNPSPKKMKVASPGPPLTPDMPVRRLALSNFFTSTTNVGGPPVPQATPYGGGSGFGHPPVFMDHSASLAAPCPPPVGASFGPPIMASMVAPVSHYQLYAASTPAKMKIRGLKLKPPSTGAPEAEPAGPPTPRDRAKTLIALQSFEGHFSLSDSLSKVLGVALSDLTAKLDGLSSIAINLEGETRTKLWATILAIKAFELHFSGEMDMCELVVEKAKAWVEGLSGVPVEEVKKMELTAAEVLSGGKA